MSFTYDITTDVGKLRAEIGDVNSLDYMFSDEELEWFIEKANGNLFWAKIYVAENRCMISASQGGIELVEGDARIKTSADIGNNWCNLAKEWRQMAESGIASDSGIDPFFYIGGVYFQDRKNNEQDIEDNIILQRDFYDNFNDDFPSGKIIENTER